MTMRRSMVIAALAIATLSAAAAPPAFRYARPIVPAGAGPNRLTVDVSLMTGAQPIHFDAAGRMFGGLADLRLTGPGDVEVPYLVVPPPDGEVRWQGGRLAPIAPTDDASGFEVDLGTVVTIDRARVSGLPTPLLKRVRVEASGDRTRWVVLADETTIFDLPADGLRRTEIAFPATPARHLRFTWDDHSSGRVPLPATVMVSLVTAPAPVPPPVVVPLVFERRPSEPGRSRFRIHLPGPGLPIRALDVDAGGERLLRRARVTEAALAGDAMAPHELGSALLRRVSRDAMVASDLRIPVATPREIDLDLDVDDGDNPPLDLRGVRAELAPLPWLYFESADGAPLMARFGARNLAAPRYDLEAARGAIGETALRDATWGERSTLAPVPEPPATDGNVVTAGAPIDRSAFRHLREIPDGPMGLTALRLDAAVLAHSNRLADVRVIDATGQQVPYVVERVDEPLEVSLGVPVVTTEVLGATRSVGTWYRVELPYARLPPARLVLVTEGRLFERNVMVWMERERPDGRRDSPYEVVGNGSWRHVDPEHPAPSLTVGLASLGRTTILVEVDDGDNGRLPLGPARLLLPTQRLRFVRASDGPLTLAYGAPELAAPRYDLALLAPRILGASAHEVDASPEVGGVPDERSDGRDTVGPRIFWTVLAMSLLVLLVVLTRLVRIDEPDPA